MVLVALGNALSALAPSYSCMLTFRFLAGLPHGAYVGVAALAATALVPSEKRALAVARLIPGFTIATVVGVSLTMVVGRVVGWRWAFSIIAGLAPLTVALVRLHAPLCASETGDSATTELGALKRAQVWPTLATGQIGFGGLFAVYTYLASTFLEVTHARPAMIPAALAAFGIGMTAGNLVCAWAADCA